MYNPCLTCLNRYGKSYSSECDDTCEYAYVIKSMKYEPTNDTSARMIRILENDDIIVDYNKDKHAYRISIFKDNHFIDECWFDEYKEKVQISE